MYLDEANKQKLAGALSEAKKRYGPAALGYSVADL
jgi:hypothetical protein